MSIVDTSVGTGGPAHQSAAPRPVGPAQQSIAQGPQAVPPSGISAAHLQVLVAAAATAISAGALLLSGYPEDEAAKKLLHHAAGELELPAGLLFSSSWLPSLQVAFAWFLLMGTPITAAVLAYLNARQPKLVIGRINVSTAAFLLSAAAMLIYVLYFARTYHAGVLILAVLAWIIAASHAGEISEVGDEVARVGAGLGEINDLLAIARQQVERLSSETSQELAGARKDLERVFTETTNGLADVGSGVERLFAETKKGLNAVSRTNAEKFYEDFYRCARESRTRILSVERMWTIENEVWPNLERVECFTYLQDVQAFVDRLAAESDFYRNIAQSSANDVLFIGPFPQRNEQGSFTRESFPELMALVHTVCLLELIRSNRLHGSPSSRKHAAQERQAGAWPRIQCAIGDVPVWAKIVDHRCWFLTGNATGNFHVHEVRQRGLHTADGRQVAALEDLIDFYERNARRAHEHIKLAILRAGVRLGFDGSVCLGPHIDALAASVVTGLRGDEAERALGILIEEYRRTDPAMDDVTPQHIVFLFSLFIGLYFRDSGRRDRRTVAQALSIVTMDDLWESVA
jgi:hypothetical protein